MSRSSARPSLGCRLPPAVTWPRGHRALPRARPPPSSRAGDLHPELHAATPFLRPLLWAAPRPHRVTGDEVPLSAAGCTPSPGVLACSGAHYSRGGGVRWVPSPHRWAQGTNAPAPRFCLPGCWTRAPLQPPCLFCSLPAFLFLFFSPSVHIPASHFHFLGPGPAFTAESGVVPLQGVVLFGRAQFSLVSGASAVVQALC